MQQTRAASLLSILTVRSSLFSTDIGRLPVKTAVHFVLLAILVLPPGREVIGADPVKGDEFKAIEQANAAFAAAYAKGDAKAVAEMYTEKARLLPPNSPVVEGRKAIEAFWKGAMTAGIKTFELKTVEVESSGDMLVEQGTATLFSTDGAVVDRAKYIVLWKRVDGQWKLHRDCWNSNEPAARK
jgi:uncharacterized protein (TIGR02246 family)